MPASCECAAREARRSRHARTNLVARRAAALLVAGVATAGTPVCSVPHALARLDDIASRAEPETRRELLELRAEIASLEHPSRERGSAAVAPDEILDEILTSVNRAQVRDELVIIKGAARAWSFRTDQVKRVLHAATPSNEVEAAVTLYPRTVDPWRWNDVHAGTTSGEIDREIQRRILELDR